MTEQTSATSATYLNVDQLHALMQRKYVLEARLVDFQDSNYTRVVFDDGNYTTITDAYFTQQLVGKAIDIITAELDTLNCYLTDVEGILAEINRR